MLGLMIEANSLTSRRLKRIRNVSRLFRILCGLGVVFGSLLAVASWFAPIRNTSELKFYFGSEKPPPEKVLAEAPSTYRVRFSLKTDEDEANAAPMEERVKPGMR